jgi:2-polyprenyl-6-methoxyphenol hydroxylase-like FAD-dependent oxidoreductase
MKIVIAGAGIGGLTAALTLHAAGFSDIMLLESAPKVQPIGVGLNILPNAVRELDGLGLADRLYEVAVLPSSLSYYNHFGSLIWNEPRGRAAGYHWPQLSIHRGCLQTVLLEAVRERLGEHAVRLDSRVTGFKSRPSAQVEITVAHRRAGTISRISADVLVGADGIHSTIRSMMYSSEGAPCWNGLIVWRGMTWAEPFLDAHTMIIAGDTRRRAVVYPMSAPTKSDSMVLTNWALARPAVWDEILDFADWNRPVASSRFLDHFADLCFDWLDIPKLIRSSEEALEYPMVDRDPIPCWTTGRVTLLGDAAHAMNPMGSNGATQSMVDAQVLAAALAGHRDVEQALRAYEAARRPDMTKLQLVNRMMGPEVIIDIVHERAPDGFQSIDQVIPIEDLATISSRYARLGAFDPETVNTISPYLGPAVWGSARTSWGECEAVP